MKTQLALLALLLEVAGLAAQTKPDHRDVAYDATDKAQVLDVYLAKSKKPAPVMVYIHGGGWRAGTKNNVPGTCYEHMRRVGWRWCRWSIGSRR